MSVRVWEKGDRGARGQDQVDSTSMEWEGGAHHVQRGDPMTSPVTHAADPNPAAQNP